MSMYKTNVFKATPSRDADGKCERKKCNEIILSIHN